MVSLGQLEGLVDSLSPEPAATRAPSPGPGQRPGSRPGASQGRARPSGAGAPAPARPAPVGGRVREVRDRGRYLASQVERLAAEVASAPEGERNVRLNRAAFKLAQVQADDEAGFERLAAAAIAAGLEPGDVASTIASGRAKGAASPIELVETPGQGSGRRPPGAPPGQGTGGRAPPGGGPAAAAGEPPREDLPTIKIRTHVQGLADEAEEVLVLARRNVYGSAGQLVRVYDRKGRLGLEPLPEPSLLELLSDVAIWKRVRQNKEGGFEELPAKPPRDVVSALASRGRWHLPEVEVVVDVPILRPDGSIVTETGPDRATRAYFLRRRDVRVDVPERPTREQAEAALGALLEPFEDFPFVAPSDRSAAQAFLLTLLGRRAIEGPTPFFLVKAAERGTGKTLLVNLVATIATGAPVAPTTQPENKDEDRKQLISVGIMGVPLLLIDNVERKFGNETLSSAVTSGVIQGRILNANRMVTVAVPVMAATGNNVVVTADFVRRVVPIVLRAQEERPEQRSGFRIEELVRWAQTNRWRLVSAGLTILRWYALLGRPKERVRAFGSFEAWSDVVRQALLALGMADPLDSAEREREDADDETEVLASLFECWHARFGERPVSVRELLEQAEADEDLGDALVELVRKKAQDAAFDPRAVGHKLRSAAGSIKRGRRLEQAGRTKVGRLWRVVLVGEPGPVAGPPPADGGGTCPPSAEPIAPAPTAEPQGSPGAAGVGEAPTGFAQPALEGFTFDPDEQADDPGGDPT